MFERFEQRCTQSPVFPGCFLEDCREELSLFGLVLVAEGGARGARQSGEVECRGERELLGFACGGEFAFDLFLLCLEGARFLVVQGFGDALVESVVVERAEAVLDACSFCLQALDRCFSRAGLCLVGRTDLLC